MTVAAISRWQAGALLPLDSCDLSASRVLAADSWLVTDGTALAIDLHRDRFTDAVDRRVDAAELTAFWAEVIAAIPRTGDWFPRVELRASAGSSTLVFRLRPAPERQRTVRLASHRGPDPRTHPAVKGPATDALARARTAVQQLGADEAVILSPEGFVVEGAFSSLLWWRGDFICVPSDELTRVDSVTARSIIAMAAALGVDVHRESVTPAELDGLEIWSLSALHGIRIVTGWVDGPQPAEQPGRLRAWQSRLERLRKPLPADDPDGSAQ
jgi:branched-subunit amino acid aminotransferase/4-amino-4-deoxychorismate lyase